MHSDCNEYSADFYSRLDSDGNIKVSDFGLSEDVYTTGYFREDKDSHVKLPFKWMAPESLIDRVFNEKTDVWSFGVTCWEIFSGGRTPYPAVNPSELPRLLEEGMRLEYPSNAANSPEIHSIICKCWKFSPDDRPNFESLTSSFQEKLQLAAGYLEHEMALEIQAESREYVTIQHEVDGSAAHASKPEKKQNISAECEIVRNIAYSFTSEEPKKQITTEEMESYARIEQSISPDSEAELIKAFEMVANTAYSTSSDLIKAKEIESSATASSCSEAARLVPEFEMEVNTSHSTTTSAPPDTSIAEAAVITSPLNDKATEYDVMDNAAYTMSKPTEAASMEENKVSASISTKSCSMLSGSDAITHKVPVSASKEPV